MVVVNGTVTPHPPSCCSIMMAKAHLCVSSVAPVG